jgi:hypothetical protein
MTLRLISWASDWLLDGFDGLVQVFGWLLGSQLSHSTFFSLLFYTYVPFLGLSGNWYLGLTAMPCAGKA